MNLSPIKQPTHYNKSYALVSLDQWEEYRAIGIALLDCLERYNSIPRLPNLFSQSGIPGNKFQGGVEANDLWYFVEGFYEIEQSFTNCPKELKSDNDFMRDKYPQETEELAQRIKEVRQIVNKIML